MTLLSSLVRKVLCVGSRARTGILYPCCRQVSGLRSRHRTVSIQESQHTLSTASLPGHRAVTGQLWFSVVSVVLLRLTSACPPLCISESFFVRIPVCLLLCMHAGKTRSPFLGDG